MISTIREVESRRLRSFPRPHLDRVFDRSNLCLTSAFVFCILFGSIIIANTHAAGEGVWFWLSFFHRSGKHLYADMHLALQPVFVLESNVVTAVLGSGWLASKIAAAIHLAAYCVALLLLVRQSALSSARKAILFVFCFFVSISFEAYHFCDYHVLADCFVLYSLVVVLSLATSSSVRRILGTAAILGALVGLTLTTRLNDGAGLFVGIFFAVLCLSTSRKLLAVLLFSLTTGLTAVLMVLLTGDTLRDYATYSILKSAGSKGGAGSVVSQPLGLPWNTVKWLIRGDPMQMLLCSVVLGVAAALLMSQLRRSKWWQHALAIVGLVLIVFQAYLAGLFESIALLSIVAGIVVLVVYAIGIWVAIRATFGLLDLQVAKEWDRREVLLLIPLGQLASIASRGVVDFGSGVVHALRSTSHVER